MAKNTALRAPDAFAIEIDFTPGIGDPSRIFKTAISLLNEIALFDSEFAKSIDSDIKSTLLLQEVEEGSLRIWLITVLQAFDDDALKSGDWKKIVGSFLYKAKQKVLEYLQNGQEDLKGSGAGLDKLREELLTEAQQLEVGLPTPAIPSRSFLILLIVQIAEALKPLQPGEEVFLEDTSGNRTAFPKTINLSGQDVERLTVAEDKYFDSDVVLPVKKPDFIGNSKWEFIHDGHAIEAKILDGTWLESFQHQQVAVPPGSSLDVKLRQDISFGADNEHLGVRYSILQVFGVVPPRVVPKQTNFIDQ